MIFKIYENWNITSFSKSIYLINWVLSYQNVKLVQRFDLSLTKVPILRGPDFKLIVGALFSAATVLAPLETSSDQGLLNCNECCAAFKGNKNITLRCPNTWVSSKYFCTNPSSYIKLSYQFRHDITLMPDDIFIASIKQCMYLRLLPPWSFDKVLIKYFKITLSLPKLSV